MSGAMSRLVKFWLDKAPDVLCLRTKEGSREGMKKGRKERVMVGSEGSERRKT
jgi:hypothetical protein